MDKELTGSDSRVVPCAVAKFDVAPGDVLVLPRLLPIRIIANVRKITVVSLSQAIDLMDEKIMRLLCTTAISVLCICTSLGLTVSAYAQSRDTSTGCDSACQPCFRHKVCRQQCGCAGQVRSPTPLLCFLSPAV